MGNGKLVPEGVEGRVPFKGPLDDFVYQLGGRTACGHGVLVARGPLKSCGQGRNSSRFRRRVSERVYPHDIAITQE